MATSKRIKIGPWGGQGGVPWDDGNYRGILSITLVYDRCINSIRVEYDKNGRPILGERHGGSGGRHVIQIKFAYPEEYLTDISGYIAPMVHGGSPVIRSLRFNTNKQTFGPYGIEEGTPFTIPIEGGMVIGFHGRSSQYLDSIGMYLSRIHASRIYIYQKMQKLGEKLGHRDGARGCPYKAGASRDIAAE
ncbi:uncharacterized protein A4U43_C05F28950 [Asparagus officinalis]|uniref:Jacalin-type lectin domain-containing protein n=2 Tax=Asparagus officinalis TaxID=4686 RepID=A0A5P1EZK0_ASPOF|nr:uncharacterized protein A4U43_C05F28950 [Asparagus officinalis]